MESSNTRSKRRRLISISSHVSSQWPDLPAKFESLNDDTLATVLEFVGNKSYAVYAMINKHSKEVYLNTPGMTKETFIFGYGTLSRIIDRVEGGIQIDPELHKRVGKGVVSYGRIDVFKWALQQRNYDLLQQICNVAAKEERIDLLDEVLSNIEDEGAKEYVFHYADEDEGAKEYVFHYVDGYAAQGGKMNVLNWFETKGFTINKDSCAYGAARHGQLHIIQWLQGEKGFEFYKDFYVYAINGGHLHIMKWFREQEVPWDLDNFKYAAKEGNLDVLQWLQDEGCPWPDDLCVNTFDLKPEVRDWCRVNGYGDRMEDLWSDSDDY